MSVKYNAYAGSTVQQEQLSLQPQQEAPKKEPSPKERVLQLLEKMKTSLLFSPAMQEIIKKWEEESLNTYFDDLSSDVAQDEASKVLSYLLIDVIDQALYQEKTLSSQGQIFDFREELVTILKSVLPSGIDVDRFIAERKANHRKIQMYVKKRLLEINCLDKSKRELLTAGNQLNQQNVDQFEGMKVGLLKTGEERDEAVLLEQGALKKCEEMFSQTRGDLQNVLERAKTSSKQMQAVQGMVKEQRQDLLNNAQEITKI